MLFLLVSNYKPSQNSSKFSVAIDRPILEFTWKFKGLELPKLSSKYPTILEDLHTIDF